MNKAYRYIYAWLFGKDPLLEKELDCFSFRKSEYEENPMDDPDISGTFNPDMYWSMMRCILTPVFFEKEGNGRWTAATVVPNALIRIRHTIYGYKQYRGPFLDFSLHRESTDIGTALNTITKNITQPK